MWMRGCYENMSGALRVAYLGNLSHSYAMFTRLLCTARLSSLLDHINESLDFRLV